VSSLWRRKSQFVRLSRSSEVMAGAASIISPMSVGKSYLGSITGICTGQEALGVRAPPSPPSKRQIDE